jgi:hypothetical protein
MSVESSVSFGKDRFIDLLKRTNSRCEIRLRQEGIPLHESGPICQTGKNKRDN